MPDTSLPGTSWPGFPASSQKFAPTVLGDSVLSRGDGLGLAAGGEMKKLLNFPISANGQRAALVAA